MRTKLLQEIISTVCKCHEGGFGYVESFMNVLCEHRRELNISSGVVVWSLHYNGEKFKDMPFNYYYYVNDKELDLTSFKIDEMALHKGVLNSKNLDFEVFKESSNLRLAHTIAIPIHFQKGNEDFFEIYGVILMISPTTINFSEEELEIIYELLSNCSPSTVGNPNVISAINKLASEYIDIRSLRLKDRHRTLNEALDILAEKGKGKSIPKHGLRHFSFWSVDYENGIYVSKEFNKNTVGSEPHDNTHSFVVSDDHFIYTYAEKLREKKDGEDILIQILDYNSFQKSIKDKSYFKKVGIEDDNSVVIIVPIQFEQYSSICCFYVRDIFYTPFVSITFIKEFVDAIRQRITLVNEINIRNILSAMMMLESSFSDRLKFYKEVVDILKDGNEANDCLIYLRNSRNDRYMLMSLEDEENISTIKESNFEKRGFSFYLPQEYYSDKSFFFRLKNAFEGDIQHELYENPDGVKVKSYCLCKFGNRFEKLDGFILLLNKNHDLSGDKKGLYFHDTFYYNNVYITNACFQYLDLHRKLELSNLRREELLKKYRHEIPNCIQVVNGNIMEIENMISPNWASFYEFKRKVNDIKINCERVNMLASFFSAIDSDEIILRNYRPIRFNIRQYLESHLEVFLEEGSYRGVYISCDIDNNTPIQTVSLFYQLSLTNIITNAIRYAAAGTCIVIKATHDFIEVTDLGIPVRENDKEKIFEEGYRSMEARRVEQNGKGYGLYLTKRIIEAHQQKIEVNSEIMFNRNYFAESALCYMLKNMSKVDAENFLYPNGLLPTEKQQIIKLYAVIRESNHLIKPSEKCFMNRNQDSLKRWINYNKKWNHILLDMEEDFFNKQIYKVTFKINL